MSGLTLPATNTVQDTPAAAGDVDAPESPATPDTIDGQPEREKRARTSSPGDEEGEDDSGPSKKTKVDPIPEDAEFDEAHNHPSAGVILVSDNVAEPIYFRVHRHALMKAWYVYVLHGTPVCADNRL
jgi:hypothetical protein